MSSTWTFVGATILMGIGWIGFAGIIFFYIPKHPDCWKTLPRNPWIGGILGTIVIAWAIYQGRTFFYDFIPAIRNYLLPISLLIIGLSIWSIQYPFSRALGGFLTLTMVELIHGAFVAHAPWRPLYSILCYFFIVIGLIWIGSPWRFRDWLRTLIQDPKKRVYYSSWLTLNGVIFLLVGIATIWKKS